MPALAALLGELVTFVSRFFFLFKDLFIILKYNIQYLGRIFVGFFPWLADIGNWIWSFIVTLPGHMADAAMDQFAKLINLALGAFPMEFIATAAAYSDYSGSIAGLAYFASPFRVSYGVGLILTAYVARFFIKMIPHIPISKFPRLPGVRWPSSGSGV